MSPPKVSVVTSAYSAEKFIARAIESVLGQTFTDFEFILVDDCSQDRTWSIIQQYAGQDRRIVALRNELNLGVVGGLNRGLERARGEYIARQDADDISLPERFAVQVGFLDSHPDYGVIGSLVTYIGADGQPFDAPNPFLATENDEIQEKLVFNNCLCGPAVMIRRGSFVEAGFSFSEGLDASEDYDLCLRLAEVSKMAAIPEPLYHYRQHPQSASIVQEYKQAVNKAIALERALTRRFGKDIPIRGSEVLGWDYFWAALLAYTQGDFSNTPIMMEKALACLPKINQEAQKIEKMIQYKIPGETGPALSYVNDLFFDHLPRTGAMNRLRSRMISSIHMKSVFSNLAQGDREHIRYRLWIAIINNPQWLLNRGVLSIIIKHSFIRKIR